MEIFLVGAILLFIFIYSGKINTSEFADSNKDLIMLLKEDDYDFLLINKYGDRVYDPNEVFMKRVRKAGLIIIMMVAFFISSMSFLNIIIAFIIGYVVFKMEYLSLRSYYKAHLSEVDSLLPYFLRNHFLL